jgi:hypothetical protein
MLGLGTDAWYIRIRDFAFPVIVLSSFYLLTQAVVRQSAGFWMGLRRRTERLAAPAMVWSLLYWYAWPAMVALLTDESLYLMPLPTWHLLVGGFMHLWYLMFLYFTSITFLGLMEGARRIGQERWLSRPWLWLLLAAVYLVWVRDPLLYAVAPLGELGSQSWFLFKRQSLIMATYIAVGVALGLMAGRISRAGRIPVVRYGAAAVAVVLAALYAVGPHWQYARECFSLTVFLAFLMPWRIPGVRWWGPPASESYAIYILHYGVAQAVVLMVLRFTTEVGLGTIVATTAGVYALCFLIATVGRRLALFNWLLPRVPVEGLVAATGGQARRSHAPAAPQSLTHPRTQPDRSR